MTTAGVLIQQQNVVNQNFAPAAKNTLEVVCD
jgi:hypothetical protein